MCLRSTFHSIQGPGTSGGWWVCELRGVKACDQIRDRTMRGGGGRGRGRGTVCSIVGVTYCRQSWARDNLFASRQRQRDNELKLLRQATTKQILASGSRDNATATTIFLRQCDPRQLF